MLPEKKDQADIGTWRKLIMFGMRDLRNAQLCHSCSSIPFKVKTHGPQKPSIHARHTSEMLKEQTLGVLGLKQKKCNSIRFPLQLMKSVQFRRPNVVMLYCPFPLLIIRVHFYLRVARKCDHWISTFQYYFIRWRLRIPHFTCVHAFSAAGEILRGVLPLSYRISFKKYIKHIMEVTGTSFGRNSAFITGYLGSSVSWEKVRK